MEIKKEPDELNDCDAQHMGAVTPIHSSHASLNSMPYLEIQIDEMDLKKELADIIKVKNTNAIKNKDSRNIHNLGPFPGLAPRIKLHRTPFHKRNFVCNVCYSIFPTVARQKRHRLLHEEPPGLCDDRQLSCQINPGMPPIWDDNASSSLTPYFDLDIDEMDIKKEVTASKLRSDIRSNDQFPNLLSLTPLMRLPSYRRYFVCCVCFVVFPTTSEREFHMRLFKKSECRDLERSTVQKFHVDRYKLFVACKSKKSGSGQKFVKCDQCEYVCGNINYMKTHQMMHTGEKPYTCDECDYSSTYVHSIKKHKMIHSGEKPFKCDLCDFACITSSGLKVHRTIHAARKPFKCDRCDYACRRSIYLKVHKMIHSGEKPFSCGVCNYSSARFDDLKKHRMTHLANKPFKCDKCGFTCTRSSHLKIHRMIHTGQKPLKCDKCDYSCIQTSALIQHKKVHLPKKSFKCDDCNYTCVRPFELKLHNLTHSGKKPLKCEECGYRCIRFSHMLDHKMIHSGERPYKCDECDYTCIQSRTLIIHMIAHTRKTLRCDKCDYTCIQMSNLNRHKTKHL